MQPTLYPGAARWTGASAPRAPNVRNNLGYDVTAPRLPDVRREDAYNVANGTVNNGTWQWPLFITDVSIDIAIAGSTAQSRTTREFYPHNFTQPSFTVQGQALDQEDYGMLCEYMHYVQQDSIANGGKLLQFWLKGGGIPGGRQTTVGVRRNGQLMENQIIRGAHNQIACQGFVTNMPREHRTGVVSPTYTFSLAVAWMIHGVYSDMPVQIQQQKNWIEILQSTSNLNTKPLVKANTKILDWAQKNSANIFNTGS